MSFYFICTHPLSIVTQKEIKNIADYENNFLDLLAFLDIVLKLNTAKLCYLKLDGSVQNL